MRGAAWLQFHEFGLGVFSHGMEVLYCKSMVFQKLFEAISAYTAGSKHSRWSWHDWQVKMCPHAPWTKLGRSCNHETRELDKLKGKPQTSISQRWFFVGGLFIYVSLRKALVGLGTGFLFHFCSSGFFREVVSTCFLLRGHRHRKGLGASSGGLSLQGLESF